MELPKNKYGYKGDFTLIIIKLKDNKLELRSRGKSYEVSPDEFNKEFGTKLLNIERRFQLTENLKQLKLDRNSSNSLERKSKLESYKQKLLESNPDLKHFDIKINQVPYQQFRFYNLTSFINDPKSYKFQNGQQPKNIEQLKYDAAIFKEILLLQQSQ